MNVLPIENVDNDCMESYIKSYFQESEAIIKNTIESNVVILEKEVNLLAFNVYNAIYNNGYIISKYFVMYEDIEPVILYGDFLIETPAEGVITKIYRI